MTQEEKAKAYDKAIERAKYWRENPTVWSSDDICQKLFPELKEGKDEKRIEKQGKKAVKVKDVSVDLGETRILPSENVGNSGARVVSINENTPHKVSEVICVKCAYRWLAVRPVTTLLKDLECPQCSRQGFVIETGEVIN